MKRVRAAIGIILGLLLMAGFMIVGYGIALMLTLFATAAVLLLAPALWLSGRSRLAVRLITAWTVYAALYLAISTAVAVARPVGIAAMGQQLCADAGCFAIDKADRAGDSVVLSWRLSSTDKGRVTHFPGGGLAIYMLDDRGRRFDLPAGNETPLDVDLQPGETIRRSMQFNLPADARELFLAWKYRPFTFQSLLPGELSLVTLGPKEMIRIL